METQVEKYECCVCYNETDTKTSACNHYLCIYCFDRLEVAWGTSKRKCPTCRSLSFLCFIRSGCELDPCDYYIGPDDDEGEAEENNLDEPIIEEGVDDLGPDVDLGILDIVIEW